MARVRKDSFLQPKVLFMLMVICLGPLAWTIHTMQACPSGCSDEEAAVAAAENKVREKKVDLKAKDENHRKARAELQKARRNVTEAKKGLKKARNKAVMNEIKDGLDVIKEIPKLVPVIKKIFSWGYGIVKSFRNVYDVGKNYREALKQQRDRQREFGEAKQELNNAKQILKTAQDALAGVKAALEACEAGE